jgi:hypothetical protein
MPTFPLRPWSTLLAVALTLTCSQSPVLAANVPAAVDVVVFGGTSAGIIAAIQSAKSGKSVVVVEPGSHLGGLTTGGLGATDIGNKAAIGGLSREFYHRVALHYAQPTAWKYETAEDYFRRRGSGQAAASELSGSNATMWTFEPHVAAGIYSNWLAEAKIPLHAGKRLASVRKDGLRIMSFTTEDGSEFRGQMFIDATYEGDLLAKARVSYHVGREANAAYGETLNGICAQTPKHQFTVGVDPYVKPGDPASGLLPYIQGTSLGGRPGDGDRRVQAYNYRLCFTTNAANRLPLPPPAGYDPAKYELLARYLEALVAAGKRPTLAQFWNPIWMPNHKTDINNNGAFSTDFIGMNWGYAEAGYADRRRSEAEHEYYVRGFLHFLATSPRVPENLRSEMQTWGPCKDEFAATGGWPSQIYVREARRMIADVVMAERHCRGQEVVTDSVGLAAYNMDSHNCQRIVRDGHAENEGDVQVPPMKPYPISYRAIIPKAAECENLLVPVCLSASHIAYGSIRMEPVFMILGQSAASAAALALDEKVPLPKLDYAKLRARLQADAQVLEWRGSTGGAASGGTHPLLVRHSQAIICDDSTAQRSSDDWQPGNLRDAPCIGGSYLHDGGTGNGHATLTFAQELRAGRYEARLLYPAHGNRATNALVVLVSPGALEKSQRVNQRTADAFGGALLGIVELAAPARVEVRVSNPQANGHVVADAVAFVPLP